MQYAKPRIKSATPAVRLSGGANPSGLLNRRINIGGEYRVPQGFRQATPGGSVAVPDIAAACINHITSRACQAEMMSDSQVLLARAMRVHPDYVPRDFWRGLFEAVLVHGGVVIYRWDTTLRFGTVSTASAGAFSTQAGDMANWVVQEYQPRSLTVKDRHFAYERGGLARWSSGQGQSLTVESPLQLSAGFLDAYRACCGLLMAYGTDSHKIGGVLEITNAVNDPERLGEYVQSMTDHFKRDGHYRTPYTEWGTNYKTVAQPAAPALMEAIEQAKIGVAVQFGVPIQLLGITPKGARLPAGEVEEHIMNDAVQPLLDTVAAAVTRAVVDRNNSRGAIHYDTSKLGMPGFKGMAEALMKYSQSGLYTIDEIRAMKGDPPLPDGRGNVLPTTAGAGDRTGTNERMDEAATAVDGDGAEVD